MADSESSANLCRARETRGVEGTRSISFFTSSKGSNTIPVNDLALVPFAARTENVYPRHAREGNRRFDVVLDGGNRSPPPELKRESAGDALSNIGYSND